MRIWAALLIVVFCGVAHSQSLNAKIDVGPVPSWVQPAPIAQAAATPRVAGYNSVIELSDTQWRADGPRSERYVREVARVQEAPALQYWGSIRLGFVPDYERLQLHEVVILRDAQRIDVRDKLTFSTSVIEPMLEQLSITGRAVAVAQVPDLRVGDRLVVAYSVIGQNPVFGEQFVATAAWAFPTLVEHRHTRLLHKTSQPVRHSFVGFGPQPTATPQQDWTELVWQQFQLLPPKPETLLPRGFFTGSVLVMSSFADWQSVRKWGHELFEFTPNAEVQALAKSWQKNGEPLSVAVNRAVRFVQDDIRYFSISVGDNSHRPRAPEVTLKQRFGDCKDKSVLLAALLRAMGLQANPVLVSQSYRQFAARFGATPLAFDHAVVRFELEGKSWVIDPTRLSQGLSFEIQPNEQAGSLGLDLTPTDKAQLQPMGAVQARAMVDTQILVNATGLEAPAEFTIVSRYFDDTAERVRAINKASPRSERDEAMLKQFRAVYTNAQAVPGYPTFTDDAQRNVLTIEERYKTESFMRKEQQQNLWFAGFGASRLLNTVAPANINKDRVEPLGLLAPGTSQRFAVTVTFPSNITGSEDPSNDVIKNSYFELKTSRSFRGNVFAFNGEVSVFSDLVQAADVPAFAKQMEELHKRNFDVLVLTPRNVTAAALVGKPLGERLRDEYTSTVNNATQVIEAAKLADADLAEAYLDRASARSALNDLAGAAADLAQAARLAPRSSNVLIQRAMLATRQGRFAAAQADASRALVLGADAASAYIDRGQARWLQGDYANALEDFLSAEKANVSGSSQGFVKIWQALTRLHLKQDLGPMPDLKGQWPQPVLRMIWTPVQSAAELEAAYQKALSEGKTGSADETLRNACEVHFYAAVLARLRSDTARSAALLQATLATEVLDYAEYNLAHALLATPQK
jgi:tetratricopeptide (TPR) repeat protein